MRTVCKINVVMLWILERVRTLARARNTRGDADGAQTSNRGRRPRWYCSCWTFVADRAVEDRVDVISCDLSKTRNVSLSAETTLQLIVPVVML